MSQPALEALVEQIRSLPGSAEDRGMPRAAATPAARLAEPVAEAVAEIEPRALRARAGAWLSALGAAVEDALAPALARATHAWDQADAFAVLDAELREEALALRRAGEALAAGEDDDARATGLEALILVDAAVGLVSLFERRFAAILRLRLRSATPELF